MTFELTTAGIAVTISALSFLYMLYRDRQHEAARQNERTSDRETIKQEVRENCISEVTQRVALMEQIQQEMQRQQSAMFRRIDEVRKVQETQGKQITAIATVLKVKNGISLDVQESQ